ncbi:MAG: NF038129 family PEP-CTERM protein [Alphaproteobacteria bacterium]|nr:NF038129 family PEP-CTERM protein [Alphaproteobacteria bacterium]
MAVMRFDISQGGLAMHFRSNLVRAIAGLAIGALGVRSASAAPITYAVTVDTSAVTGQSGWIDIQFNPGGLDTQSAVITITNFATDASLFAASVQLMGGASGLLPGTVTITNSSGFNDYFESLTFGTSITFQLSFDGPALAAPNGTALSSSTFALAFYDSSITTALLTTDPNGMAGLIDVNLDGTTTPTTFPVAVGGLPAVTFTPIAAIVEPPSLPLLLAGLLGLLAVAGSRRIVRQRSRSTA